MGRMGIGSRRRTGGIPRGLLLALLLCVPAALPGCASTNGGDGEVVVRRDSFFTHLLPEPVGKVAFSEEPVIWTVGWVGMIAGGTAAGWAMVEAWYPHTPSADGEAIFVVFTGGVLLGALLGGILVAAPVRGIKEFLRWLFG